MKKKEVDMLEIKQAKQQALKNTLNTNLQLKQNNLLNRSSTKNKKAFFSVNSVFLLGFSFFFFFTFFFIDNSY
jgi:hypothetical protein